MNTATVSGIIISTAAGVILLLVGVIKALVADHLRQIRQDMAGLKEANADHQDQLQDHSTRLVRIETTMRLNGCLDGEGMPRCGA